MMAITTGQQSVVAEASRPKHVAPESSSSVTPENIPLDLSPSQSHDRYEPLPPGTWTLTFHGNCPRCHHHNNSLKVQIEVTPDDSQVSYVRCERCLDRWAAFGGRNTTRTSLLSTTTTEPDDVERGVRHSLAEIVKLAQERQPLEILPESLSAVVPHQLPEDTHRTAYLSAASPFLSLSTFRSDAKEPTPEDPDRHGTSPGYALMPKRQSTSRLFSKLKRKIVARFPTLNRSHGKETTDASTPKMSMRRFEKAPVQSPPCSDQNPAWSKVPLSLEDHEAAPSSSSEVETLEPSKRIAEVVAFVASLDKSAINLMTEQERSQWLRREYTKFKVHRRKSVSVAPLGMSTIVQTSIQNELPRPPLAELPLDMFGVGGHIEGFEILDSALRRGSFTISESSGAQSMSEGTTLFESQRSSGQRHLQRLRQGLSRPQSSPYSLYAHSRLPPNTRNSHATLDLSERESVLADCNTLATPRELSPENLRESRNGLVLQRPQSLCSTTPSGSCSRPQSLCSIRPQSLRSIRTQSLRSVRPQSLRVTRRRRLHPRIRQRMRRSLESLGISSIRAHITSRASQSSTLHGSSEERVDDWDRRDLVTPMPNPNPVVTDMRIISSSVPEVSAILTDGTTLIHGQEVNLPDRTNTSSLIPRPITTAAHEESRSDLDTGPNLEILDERSSLIPVPGPDNLITHRRSTSSLIPRQSEALGSQNDLHVRSHGNDTQPNQAGGTSSGFRGGDSTPQDSGEPSSSKRPRRERPDDNNDNSDPHRRKRKQKRDFDHGESPPKPFACPFPKHDPMNHTTCWEFTFQKDRFGDLRQHFLRRHPIYLHCPRCGMSFKDNDKDRELLVHQTQPEACGLVDFRKSTDGIRVSDWLKIKQRKSKIDEQQYWMHIFEVLFDSRPQSGDPYPEDYSALALRLYQENFTRDITRILNNDIVCFVEQSRRDHSNSELPMSELLQSLPGILEQGIRSGFVDDSKYRSTTTMQQPLLEVALKLNGLQDDSSFEKSALSMVDDIPFGNIDVPIFQQHISDTGDGTELPVVSTDFTGSPAQHEQLEENFYDGIDAVSPLPWLSEFDPFPDPCS